MKILITGNPGSGKTSVSEVLEQRGYVVHDADEGFGQWIHKISGKKRYSRPTVNREDYYWVWRVQKIKRLLKDTKGNLVFFCGIASNQAELYKDFDKIVMLNCDLEIVKQRLGDRRNNPFGKRTPDFDWARENQDYIQLQLPKAKVIEIDANQSLDKVVDEVIKIADEG